MKNPVIKAARTSLEITLAALVVYLVLMVTKQQEAIKRQEAEILNLNRDKTVLIKDYQTLQYQAGLTSSGGY